MMMSVRTRSALLLLALLAVAMAPGLALAQDGAKETIDNVGVNIRGIPRLIALLSYICGAFFAASGLLKLKDWINEGDKAGLNPALFRLVLSALLIVLPHAIVLATSVFFDQNESGNWGTQDGLVQPGNMTAFKRIGK